MKYGICSACGRVAKLLNCDACGAFVCSNCTASIGCKICQGRKKI